MSESREDRRDTIQVVRTVPKYEHGVIRQNGAAVWIPWSTSRQWLELKQRLRQKCRRPRRQKAIYQTFKLPKARMRLDWKIPKVPYARREKLQLTEEG